MNKSLVMELVPACHAAINAVWQTCKLALWSCQNACGTSTSLCRNSASEITFPSSFPPNLTCNNSGVLMWGESFFLVLGCQNPPPTPSGSAVSEGRKMCQRQTSRSPRGSSPRLISHLHFGGNYMSTFGRFFYNFPSWTIDDVKTLPHSSGPRDTLGFCCTKLEYGPENWWYRRKLIHS